MTSNLDENIFINIHYSFRCLASQAFFDIILIFTTADIEVFFKDCFPFRFFSVFWVHLQTEAHNPGTWATEGTRRVFSQ